MKRNYIFPLCSQSLEWYQLFLYDDSQSQISKFSMPTKQFHMEGPVTLHTWHVPTPQCTAAFGFLFVSLLVMVHHLPCCQGSISGSHSPLFCSCPRFSQPLCPGISFSALPLLFVLLLPTSRPQYRWYYKIVNLLHLTPHLSNLTFAHVAGDLSTILS